MRQYLQPTLWILGWLICGFLHSGISYAHWKATDPNYVRRHGTGFVISCYVSGMFGPVSLLMDGLTGECGEGWILPGSSNEEKN